MLKLVWRICVVGLCEEGREVTEGFQSAVLDGRALGLTSVASYEAVLARIEASGLKLKVDLDDHLL